MAKGVRSHGLNALVLILVAYAWAGQPDAFGASAQSALLKAKQEAESKGYVLFANR